MCRGDMFGIEAESIKTLVSMESAAEQYGYMPNRSGFICCPFHAEDTPSLKIYKGGKGWYCFGCHEGGTVIDFVMKLFRLDFKEACQKLAYDFGLSQNLGDIEIDKSLIRRRKAQQRQRRAEEEQRRQAALKQADSIRNAYKMMIFHQPKSMEEIPSDEFIKWLFEFNRLENEEVIF